MKQNALWRAGLLLLVAALIIGCVGCGPEKDYPTPTDRFFVNDYADVIADADEQAIYEAGVKLYETTEAQIVLLTVDNIGGDTLEDYALTIARSWKIGDAEQDNGILLLFTVDGPHSRIEVGYGLEGAVPDGKAGRILDTYLVPWYNDSDAWSTQLADTYRALVNEVYAEYGLAESQLPLANPITDYDDDEAGGLLTIIPMLIVLVILLSSKRGGLFFLPYFGGFHGGHRGGGFSGGFRGGGGFSGGGGGFGGGGASR